MNGEIAQTIPVRVVRARVQPALGIVTLRNAVFRFHPVSEPVAVSL